MTYTSNLPLLLEQYGTENNIVGFANKYYTLWKYIINRNEANGELTFDAYFIKNLGKTNRFGDVLPYDEGLKGVEIHLTSTEQDTGLQLTPQEFKALRFSYGAEKGLVIAEYSNVNKLCWKYNNKHVGKGLSQARIDAELANIANRAIELGAQIIDDTLWTPQDVDTNLFSRGKYAGTKISECTDVQDLCWKYNNKCVKYRPQHLMDTEMENIKNRAIELGAVLFKKHMYTPSQQKQGWFIEMVGFAEHIEAGDPVEFTAVRNVFLSGTIYCHETTFHFETKYFPGTYYCQEYCLPLNNKGKATRIKNKKIRINKYEKAENEEYDNYYNVLDWEIVK